VSKSGRAAFGAPTRVAFDAKSRWLYVADASTDQVLAVNIPKTSALQSPGLRFAAPRKAE